MSRSPISMPLRPLVLAIGVAALAVGLVALGRPAVAQDFDPLEYRLGMTAKILCSGVFVQDRDPETHIAEDLAAFDHFGWGDDFRWAVDRERRRVTVSAPGPAFRTAEYNGDQGCSILPEGAAGVLFTPEEVGREWPDPAALDWPTGDRLPEEPLPGDLDTEAIAEALDWAFSDTYRPDQNTRAVVVVHRGRIVAERYAEGWGPRTPQLSWSQGKSITAALTGVLVQMGELSVEDPAPVPGWHERPNDPRRRIRVLDLLQMSSGLDFNNWGIGQPWSLSPENRHFRIYFDAVDAFRLATSVPLEFAPGTVWRYRNSDPLTLGYLVKLKAAERRESYLDFPWEYLFDRIGIRDAVLETDAWGNFLLTGYDYLSARDWARFGLLHLQDGVWEGERVLPEGWSELVSTPAPADGSRGYGGLFWLNAGGAYDRVPEDAYWAAGFMGQNTFVIPSRELVVVRLGPSPGRFGAYIDELVGRIVEAVDGG